MVEFDDIWKGFQQQQGAGAPVPAPADPSDFDTHWGAMQEQLQRQQADYESMTHAEPYTTPPAPLTWGHGKQIWDALTLGLGTKFEAAKEAAAGGREGIAAAGKSTPEDFARRYEEARAAQEAAKKQFGEHTPGWSRLETLLGSTAGLAPAMAATEGAIGAALPGRLVAALRPALEGGNLLQRGAIEAGFGAARGAEAGVLGSGLGEGTVGEQARSGAIVGGILGPIAAAAVAPTVSRITARDAEIAKNAQQLGIPLRTADIPGAPRSAQYASHLVGVPPGQQLQAATEALAKTYGSTAKKIDYQSISADRARIGAVFDAHEPRITIPGHDLQLRTDLGDLDHAASALDPKYYTRVSSAIENIESLLNGGAIDGAALKTLRGPKGSVGQMVRDSDGNIRHLGQELENVLNDAMVRHSPPDAVAALGEAKRQYKNMLIADKVSNEATGLVQPEKLLREVERVHGSANPTRAGDIGTLALAADRGMIKPAEEVKVAKKRIPDWLKTTAGVVGGAGAVALRDEYGPVLAHYLQSIPGAGLTVGAATGGAAARAAAHGLYAQTALGTRHLLDAVGAGPRLIGKPGVMLPAAVAAKNQLFGGP